MKIDKSIFVFISQSDSSFVINEISQLSEIFKNVFIIRLSSDTTSHKFSNNVKIYELDYKNYSTLNILKNHFFIFLRILFIELYKNPKAIIHLSILKRNISQLLRDIYISDSIQELSIFSTEGVFYSFWFDNWATALAILKKTKKIRDFFSLAHGFDLYEYRTLVTNRIAYRWFQLKYVTKVFSVSKTGENYLKQRYPKYSFKIDTAYLQTDYFGTNPFEPSEFTLLTCADFSPVKRIELIPEILEKITMPLTWIYIGNIDLREEGGRFFFDAIERLKQKKPFITIKILGKLKNEEVFRFYTKHSVSALLSVSESEGLPVSMMEAISFGVPVISTNVGGCSEIVNQNTGVLLRPDFTFEEAANVIMDFLLSDKNTSQFRESTFSFWKSNFSKNENNFLKKFGLGII